MNQIFILVLAMLLTLGQFASANDELSNSNEPSRSYVLENGYEEIEELDEETNPRWDKFKRWQFNDEWVQEQTELGMAGEIYSKGWLNPRVSRRIMPDAAEGWLVVDTVTFGTSLLEKLSTLAGNMLFAYFIPYVKVQAGRIKEKSFVNVRKVRDYKDALLTPHFKFSRIPLAAEDFDNIEVGEVISTVSTTGAYVRAGGGILNLIGLELPVHLNLGPKSKVTISNSLKLTISKEDDNTAVIAVEDASTIGKGFGIGFGFFFDDIIDIPVAVGINSTNGYSPLIYNHKTETKEFRTAVFKIKLDSEKGRKAYQAFLQKDFTLLEDLAANTEDDSVYLDMVKEGEIKTTESNGAIDLIIFRAGFRNIFIDAKYMTKTRDGKVFHYEEVSREDIRDKKFFSNYENVSHKFSAVIPLNNGSQSFVLDGVFKYHDTKSYGSELMEVSSDLSEGGNVLQLPIRVDEDKNYQEVQVDVRTRFTASGVLDILEVEDEDLWLSLATAVGIPDPYDWITQYDRSRYIGKGKRSKTRRDLLKRGKRLKEWFDDVRKEKTLSDKARLMMEYLRKGSDGRLFHKAMLDIAGREQIIVRGYLRGRYF